MENNQQRYFQWIAGDRKGEILVFDKIETDDGELFIVFKDTTRINEKFVAALNEKDLTGKFMAEIDSPNNCWKFKEEWVGRQEEKWEMNSEGEKVCVVPFSPGKKVTRLIPPRGTLKKSSNFGIISNLADYSNEVNYSKEITQTQLNNQTEQKIIDKNDPVYILMSKSKKLDSELNIGMVISLPPQNLYNIARDSFEDGDIKFIDYIVNDLTVEEIKDALKIAIREMYEDKPDAEDEIEGQDLDPSKMKL